MRVAPVTSAADCDRARARRSFVQAGKLRPLARLAPERQIARFAPAVHMRHAWPLKAPNRSESVEFSAPDVQRLQESGIRMVATSVVHATGKPRDRMRLKARDGMRLKRPDRMRLGPAQTRPDLAIAC
jgi:hypothetical protein